MLFSPHEPRNVPERFVVLIPKVYTRWGDAAAARRVPLRVQGRVNSGRAIWATMCQMDPPDLGQQGAIGRLARAPTTSGIIARRRDAHHIAHDANRKRPRWSSMRRNFISVLPRKRAKFFFKISLSMRRHWFSRRSGHSRRSNPCRQAGSLPACWSAAAIPPGSRHFCCAKPAAAQPESPAPRQSRSAAGRCLPKDPKPPA